MPTPPRSPQPSSSGKDRPQGKPGNGINVGKDIENWFGDVEQWGTDVAHRGLQFGKATGGVVNRNFLSQSGWDHMRHDAAHVADDATGGISRFGKATVGVVNRNFFSQSGWDHMRHDAASIGDTGVQIVNGVGAYLGIPNSITGEQGKQITWHSQLEGLGSGIANTAVDSVKGLFADHHYTTHPYAHPSGQLWLGDPKNHNVGLHQATHAALSAVNAAFDTPQHMYRAAVIAYRQHGWDGVTAILAPALAGAAAGSLVGNPELGVATGEIGAATAGVGEAVAGAATDVAATDAGSTAVADAATQVAEAGARRAVPTVAEEAQMSGVRRGTQMLIDSPIGKASKLVGSPIKAINDALISPTVAGFQVPDQAFYFSDDTTGKIWHEAQSPTKDLSTIGRGLSQQIFGTQNTWLSGTTDAVATLIAAPYEFGRAIKSSESMGRILTATDSVAVDTAFHKSSGYRRALQSISDMANGKMGKEVQQNLAGAITRAMPTLEPIAKDIADAAKTEFERAAKEGRDVLLYPISKRIGQLADQGMMVKTNLLPTTGLYGAFRMAGKLSDNYVPSKVSQILGQSPMAIDDLKQIMTTGTIRLGEPNAGYKLGQLLQQTGMKSSDITRLINDLVISKDMTKWENLTKNALKENFFNIIDQRMMKALGFDSEEWRKAFGSGLLTSEQAAKVDAALQERGFQTAYTAMRDSIHDAVDKMVGSSTASGPGGLFVLDSTGADASVLRDNRTAAVTENQRGELHLPNYHHFAQELDKLFSNMQDINGGKANFADSVSGFALRTNHGIDLWVNDRFFKPLALLTPGWALRVSLSELALNVNRLGPSNLLAGAITRSMVKSQRKAFAIAQKQAADHIKNLESRISDVRKEIAHLDQQEKDFRENARQATGQAPSRSTAASDSKREELQALLDHIEHEKSAVGTPEPTVGSGMGAGDATPPVGNEFVVNRHDEEELGRAAQVSDVNKPHGLYTSVGEKNMWSKDPRFVHEDAPNNKNVPDFPHRAVFIANDTNALRTAQGTLSHPDRRLFEGHQVPTSGGIEALRSLSSPKEFDALVKMTRPELEKALKEMGVEGDLSRYHDRYELLEIAGAQKARDAGYDSILHSISIGVGPDEFIALAPNALRDASKAAPLTAPARTREVTAPDEAGVLRVSGYLRDRGYNIDPVEAHNLHMIARGIYIGMKQAALYGIGKDEFINASAYLMYRHGGYLPPALDSIHKSMLSNVDMTGEYVQVDKVGGQKQYDPVTGESVQKPKTYKVGSRKGDIKTKMVLMSPSDFRPSQFGGKGYFEGWHYSANTLAQSQYLGRPMAAAYAKLVDEGLLGNELHDAAVIEARRIIQEMPADIRNTMSRSTMTAGQHADTSDPMMSWAEILVQKLEGVASPSRDLFKPGEKNFFRSTRAPQYTYSPHYKLIKDIARGDVGMHTNDFYERYAFQEDNQPMEREFFPNSVISRSPQFYQKRDVISHLSTVGHQKFLGPMVNYLSRQPTYIADFVLERKKLDEAIARGTITADQADVIAETTATRRTSRFIHNPEDKTKFEEMMSTAAPFYFAQNQAWRRMGRLFAENPGAFMQYAAMMMGVQQLVTDATNQNGMAIKTIPSLAMYGMPFTASLSSLQTMDPFSTTEDMSSPSGKGQTILDWIEPKFGPVVTVPTKLLYYLDPKLDKSKMGQFAERNLAGQIGTQETTSQFMFQSAIPNSLARSLIQLPVGQIMGSAGMRGTAANFLDNAYLQAEMEAARYLVSSESEKYWNSLSHKKNMTDEEKLARAENFYAWQAKRWSSNSPEGVRTTQALLDEARRRAGITWLAKIGLGFGSPVSLSVGQADAPMIQKLNNYVTDKKYGGNYMKAVDAFVKDHPWATIDTISKSKSVYGGYYPATKTMFDWLDKNQDLARQHPLAAMAMAPDLTKDTKYYQPANTLLLNLGLRARQSPQDFVDSWLVSSGNSFYYNWIKPAYDKMREDHPYEHGTAYKWRQSMVNWYGQNYNNTWLSNYNSSQGTTRKMQAITQFTEMASKTPNDPVTKGLMDLRNQIMGSNGKVGAYQQLQVAIRAGHTTSVDAQNKWHKWMDEWIKYDPRLKQGILSLFYNLG